MKIENAMIFAAGFGTRMLPLTKKIPKALLKINNKTLLEHHLQELLKLDFKRIIINAHYLSEQIISISHKYNSRVRVLVEKEILETGGGLSNALNKRYIPKDPLLLLNCDVLCRNGIINTVNQMIGLWDSRKMKILLNLINKENFLGYKGQGDFKLIKPYKKISKIDSNKKSTPLAFTGIQIFDPLVLSNFNKKRFSLSDVFKKELLKNSMFGVVDKSVWFHISSPSDYDTTIKAYKK